MRFYKVDLWAQRLDRGRSTQPCKQRNTKARTTAASNTQLPTYNLNYEIPFPQLLSIQILISTSPQDLKCNISGRSHVCISPRILDCISPDLGMRGPFSHTTEDRRDVSSTRADVPRWWISFLARRPYRSMSDLGYNGGIWCWLWEVDYVCSESRYFSWPRRSTSGNS